jgi:hypothetical protein
MHGFRVVTLCIYVNSRQRREKLGKELDEQHSRRSKKNTVGRVLSKYESLVYNFLMSLPLDVLPHITSTWAAAPPCTQARSHPLATRYAYIGPPNTRACSGPMKHFTSIGTDADNI